MSLRPPVSALSIVARRAAAPISVAGGEPVDVAVGLLPPAHRRTGRRITGHRDTDPAVTGKALCRRAGTGPRLPIPAVAYGTEQSEHTTEPALGEEPRVQRDGLR
jgi:hypothetical protein